MSSRKIIMLLCRGSKMLTFNCLTSQIDQAPIRNLELGLCITIKNQLIRFRPIFPFHTAWKLQKIKGVMNASPVWLIYTAWKVSKYGVISRPYFPVFGLNTPYSVQKKRKIRTRSNSIFGVLPRSVYYLQVIYFFDML